VPIPVFHWGPQPTDFDPLSIIRWGRAVLSSLSNLALLVCSRSQLTNLTTFSGLRAHLTCRQCCEPCQNPVLFVDAAFPLTSLVDKRAGVISASPWPVVVSVTTGFSDLERGRGHSNPALTFATLEQSHVGAGGLPSTPHIHTYPLLYDHTPHESP
jgi:hypothetical protein